MSARILALLFFIGTITSVMAQETEISVDDKKSERDSLRAQRKAWNKENTIYKPIIGLGAGVFNYIGEVNNNERTNPLINNYGVQASVIKNFTPDWGIRFDVAYGRISARDRERQLNFSSEVVTFNLHATYNFSGLLRPGRFLNPFLSVGVGAINFDAKGDLQDENGVAYNYWNDGTVRSLPESPENLDQAQILRQDYVYETDLRKANLDSLGDYAQFAFAIPVTFGLNFRVSPRSNIRLSSTFSYAFTDLIDNYTKDGIEGRKGDQLNDMYLFTAVSYHFDFFTPKKTKKTKYDEMEFASLEGDSDGDGVSDLIDKCPGTPAGGSVDENGCPLDSDLDGVYDYMDEEPNTDPNLNVDAKGVGITDDMVSLSEEDTLATLRARMFEVYPELAEIYRSTKERSNLNNGEGRADMKLVDTDGDGVISVSEVYEAIDMFFDGELDADAQFISELIDYFFDQ